jgi:hypothetical protein
MEEELRLEVEELEERVAPGLVGTNPPGQVGGHGGQPVAGQPGPAPGG